MIMYMTLTEILLRCNGQIKVVVRTVIEESMESKSGTPGVLLSPFGNLSHTSILYYCIIWSIMIYMNTTIYMNAELGLHNKSRPLQISHL
jgi:hypothetical protein